MTFLLIAYMGITYLHIFTGSQISEYPDFRILRIIKLDVSSPNAFKPLFRNVEFLLIDSSEMECLIDTTRGNHGKINMRQYARGPLMI